MFGAGSVVGGPGGTGGFAGPVQAAGMGGIVGGGRGGILGGGVTAAGLAPLGLAAAGLGLKGAYAAGQSNNAVLKGLAPVIGAASGLFGFGALTAMFPVLAAAGPLGMLIAGGIGATIGLIAILRKSATAKARTKVKDLYGVDISDRGVLQQIVDTAKQAYSGNLDMAIRSPQIRDIVELYAMATGQKPTGMPGSVRPMAFVQSGGSLFPGRRRPLCSGARRSRPSWPTRGSSRAPPWPPRARARGAGR